MSRQFLFAALCCVITTSKTVLGEEAFAGTCGGTGKGNMPVEDFHKWKSLNAHEFPDNGWLNGEQVQSLVDRSQNVGAHFCNDVRYDQFGQDQFTFAGYAICRADSAEIAAANECVTFASTLYIYLCFVPQKIGKIYAMAGTMSNFFMPFL